MSRSRIAENFRQKFIKIRFDYEDRGLFSRRTEINGFP